MSVEFSLNRLTPRICHRAVDLVSRESLYSLVFPKTFFQKRRDLKLEYFIIIFFIVILKFYNFNTSVLFDRCAFKNQKVEANKEQHRAVRNIVNNTAFPAPYIIYGPPGTGKTSTIVEAIAQVCALFVTFVWLVASILQLNFILFRYI